MSHCIIFHKVIKNLAPAPDSTFFFFFFNSVGFIQKCPTPVAADIHTNLWLGRRSLPVFLHRFPLWLSTAGGSSLLPVLVTTWKDTWLVKQHRGWLQRFSSGAWQDGWAKYQNWVHCDSIANQGLVPRRIRILIVSQNSKSVLYNIVFQIFFFFFFPNVNF